MNSIKVTKRQTDNDGIENLRKKKDTSRVTMPQIAQTPQVGLSTKYSQSNMSKLSTAKTKQQDRQTLVGKQEPHHTAPVKSVS